MVLEYYIDCKRLSVVCRCNVLTVNKSMLGVLIWLYVAYRWFKSCTVFYVSVSCIL